MRGWELLEFIGGLCGVDDGLVGAEDGGKYVLAGLEGGLLDEGEPGLIKGHMAGDGDGFEDWVKDYVPRGEGAVAKEYFGDC